VTGHPLVTAVDQFTADFTLTTQYNASFDDDNIPGYDPIPFIQSPTINPVKGKIWFNYPTAEFRIDLFSGDESAWKLSTTIIANSFNFVYGNFAFNCSTNFYTTAGLNRCWYGATQQFNLPVQMGGDMNLTYNGTRVVDGYDCMVFTSSSGYLFAVRLMDLAIVEIDLPYFISELAPYFNFLGYSSALTRVTLSNIVTGPPDASNFNVPGGACIEVYNTTVNYKEVERPLENFFTNPVAEMVKTVAKNTIFRQPDENNKKPFARESRKRDLSQSNPRFLNQTFTADWMLNASAPNAPYTPYILAGSLGFDFSVSGFWITLDKISGNVPVDLQFGFHIYPDRNGVEFLQVGPDGSCYSYLYLQWLWTYLFPIFEVPYTSEYKGTVIINGESCSWWITSWTWYENYAELYVRNSDHVLVQSTIPDPFSHSTSILTLSNVVGTVPPSSYSRPSTCAEILNWSPNWESHLPWAWCYPFC
jgi:hypothetical protein